MEFNSQICTTKEQSERLLALGLKKETADMSISTQSFDTDNGIKYSLIPYSECKYRIMYNILPVWSLHRLIEMANTYIEFSPFTGVCFRDGAFSTDRVNDYDAIIDIIAWLIKEENFNKEYLEEK